MTDIEIIGAPQSNFVRAVRMACAEKGVAYLFTPARPHTPEVDSIHPYGKIPVMRCGDYQLCESKAIVTFVDRAFPGPKLLTTPSFAAKSNNGCRLPIRRFSRR
jgi:glutathione S-transferase